MGYLFGALLYVILVWINLAIGRRKGILNDENVYTFVYVLLSPLTIFHTVSVAILEDSRVLNEQRATMVVGEDGRIIVFENFFHFQNFLGIMVSDMAEKGEIELDEDGEFDMDNLYDYELWERYVDSLERAKEATSTTFGPVRVVRFLTVMEKQSKNERNEN